MKNIWKSRKGFTLVEIVLVVAIIVILASAAVFGVVHILNNANKSHDVTALHAGCWYVIIDGEDLGSHPEERYAQLNGHWVKVVPKGTEGAQYYSDWDEMYAQVNSINVVTPMPDAPGYVPGGGGTSSGGSGGSGGSGSAGHHTQSASEMLKDFLEHYGIPYTQNGPSITWDHDGDYGGKSFVDAWNEWQNEHKNSAGGSSTGGSSTGGSSTGGSSTGGSSTGGSSTGGSSSGSSSSGGESGNGSTSEMTGTTVGHVNLPDNVVTGQHDKGVYGVKPNGNGTVTVSLQTNAWYQQDVVIAKTGNDYTLSVSGNNRYILNNGASNNLWPELDKDNKTYVLNDAQKNYLRDYWGINLV